MAKNDKNWRMRAYRNQEFMDSTEARPVRILSELLAPKGRFEEMGINNTIVFFGSARTISQEQAESNLRALENIIRTSGSSPEMDEKVRLAKIDLKLSPYYDSAAQLAHRLTQWSNQIIQKEKRFYICSGGGGGIMEAANLGAAKAGGESIGFNISLPFEQAPNPYQNKRLSFEFHYFFVRKYWFAYLAKALVVWPGGFGTMDELFELLTLLQTKKIQKKIPIVLFGTEFWKDFIDFDALVKWGVISQKDLDLIQFYDDVDAAFEYLKNTLIQLNFNHAVDG